MAERRETATKKASITLKETVHLDFYAYTTKDFQQHWEISAVLPPDKRDEAIVVGGGGWADFHPPGGAFLTCSCPTRDLDGWVVASKDHAEVVDAHQLSVYLLALRIDGMRRPDLSRLVQRFDKDSGKPVPHPEATVMVPNTHIMLSGGFWVDWHGQGNLATASFPTALTPDVTLALGWKVKSKDHLAGSPATIWAYAVGIKSMLPGAVSVKQDIVYGKSSRPENHPTMEAPLDSGFLLTGAGAQVNWTKAGNMLTRIQPFVDDKSTPVVQKVVVSAKDHKESDPSEIRVYVVGASFSDATASWQRAGFNIDGRFNADGLANYVSDLTKAGV
jgi:hypothetical protein